MQTILVESRDFKTLRYSSLPRFRRSRNICINNSTKATNTGFSLLELYFSDGMRCGIHHHLNPKVKSAACSSSACSSCTSGSIFTFQLQPKFWSITISTRRCSLCLSHNSVAQHLTDPLPLSKNCLLSLWLYLFRNLHTSFVAMRLRFMPRLSSDPTVAS